MAALVSGVTIIGLGALISNNGMEALAVKWKFETMNAS